MGKILMPVMVWRFLLLRLVAGVFVKDREVHHSPKLIEHLFSFRP